MDIKIKNHLAEIAEEKFQKFSFSLQPDTEKMLGVRVPKLRNYAKELAKGDYNSVICDNNDEFMEETMLRGMVICLCNADFDKKIEYMRGFVPQISCWAVCDTFCNGAKFVKKDLERVWELILPYLSSNEEYEVRFGVVMILNYYIVPEKIEKVLNLLSQIKHEGYYAKMAVAWAIAECCAKFPEETMEFLKTTKLDDFIYKKSIQKSIESFRVTEENKNELRKMRK